MAGKGGKRLKSSIGLARKRRRHGVPFKEERRDQELPHVGLECLWYDVTQSCIANYSVSEGARIAKLRDCGGSGFPSTPFGLAGFGLRFLHVHLSVFLSFHILSTFLQFFNFLAVLKTGKEITLFGMNVLHNRPCLSCPQSFTLSVQCNDRRLRKLENTIIRVEITQPSGKRGKKQSD